jgi:hypothetical protein
MFIEQNNITYQVLIDIEDVNKIKKYKWYLNKKGYVITHTYHKLCSVLLHRFIMNAPKELQIDHLYHNKLDNRKSQLKLCTNQENSTNRQGQHGINFDKRRNKWYARICVNYKEYFLGSFDLYNDALFARQQAEQKYFNRGVVCE